MSGERERGYALTPVTAKGLPKPPACFWAWGCGNFKTKATLVESLGDPFSDAGSIPAISTNQKFGSIPGFPGVEPFFMPF